MSTRHSSIHGLRSWQPRHGQVGQSMAEYLVGLAIVTAIVALPFDGHGSVVEYFLAMVRLAYLKFFTAIALPA